MPYIAGHSKVKNISALRAAALTTLILFFFNIVLTPCSVAFDVHVAEGDATITKDGDTTTVNINERTIFEGNTSILAHETVRFIGNNDALLRDITGSRTDWLGSLLAEGNIILVNTVGVYIAEAAKIDVASLMASTLNIQNELFLTQHLSFEKLKGLASAAILNEADIKVSDGGYIVFLADQVENRGKLTAYLGSVALGSGEKITVSFDPSGLVNLIVDQGLAEELKNADGSTADQIINTGEIHADGGKVQMTAKLLSATLKRIVNNEGIIEAGRVIERDGIIELIADGGIETTGSLVTSFLEEQGASFSIGGIFEAGHSHLRNLDHAITFSADTSLSGTISDVDDILINAGVTLTLTGDTTFWADDEDVPDGNGAFLMNSTAAIMGGGYNLTLRASENSTIGILTNIGTLTLDRNGVYEPIFSSSTIVDDIDADTFYTKVGVTFNKTVGDGSSGTPFLIYDITQLQALDADAGSGNAYQFANDIDASDTSAWNPHDDSFDGFNPIGDDSTPFTGTLDGLSHTLSGLYINRPDESLVALFGQTDGALIVNLGLTGANITGSQYTAGFIGFGTGDTAIFNSYVEGEITGRSLVTGGLIGYLEGQVRNSYFNGTLQGADIVGGVVGHAAFSTMAQSYAAGSLMAFGNVGGLVGWNEQTSISGSYSTMSVEGTDTVGGFTGLNTSDSDIQFSYATGDVTGTSQVGAFAGHNDSSSIQFSFASGQVTGEEAETTGGFIGQDDSGDYAENFFNQTANPTLTAIGSDPDFDGGITGVSLAALKDQNTFTAWDFNGLWKINPGELLHLLWQDLRFDLHFIGGTALCPWKVSNVYALQFMKYALGDYFKQTGDIDASATVDWYGGLGFNPVGTDGRPFTGSLNGQDYTITGLFINRPATDYVGLFGEASGATIKNVHLVDVSITGHDYTGALVGTSTAFTTVLNSSVSGNSSVFGNTNVGGLVGDNINSSSITNSYSAAVVQGGSNVGGLAGRNGSSASITDSYATGDVFGTDTAIGGLVGTNNASSIDNSYATGNVSGVTQVGGLAGCSQSGAIIRNTYAAGNITGTGANTGGLVGGTSYGGSIDNSYAIGNVSGGTDYTGGFIGLNEVSITDSFSTGSVSATEGNIGGFAGRNTSTIANAGWVIQAGLNAIGSDVNAGDLPIALLSDSGIGSVTGFDETSASAFYASSHAIYDTWDFDMIWEIDEGVTYPNFQWQSNPPVVEPTDPVTDSTVTAQEQQQIYSSPPNEILGFGSSRSNPYGPGGTANFGHHWQGSTGGSGSFFGPGGGFKSASHAQRNGNSIDLLP